MSETRDYHMVLHAVQSQSKHHDLTESHTQNKSGSGVCHIRETDSMEGMAECKGEPRPAGVPAAPRWAGGLSPGLQSSQATGRGSGHLYDKGWFCVAMQGGLRSPGTGALASSQETKAGPRLPHCHQHLRVMRRDFTPVSGQSDGIRFPWPLELAQRPTCNPRLANQGLS